MKFAKTFKRFSETKATNKLIAVLVVLAVVVIGVYLIVAHAATPYVAVTADSGTRSSSTTQLVSSTSATDGKHYVKFDTGTTTTSSCPSGVPVPTGDQVGWKNVFSFDFCKVPNVPLGAFSGCGGSGFNCTGLASYNNSTYNYLENNWWDNPDGWPDTNDGSTSHDGCVYAPAQTLSVTGGVLNMHIFTGEYTGSTVESYAPSESTQCMTAAPWPKISNADSSDGELYGMYSVRIKVDTTDLPCYKTAFLRWPDDGNWPQNGEIDFPEGSFSSCTDTNGKNYGSSLGGFLHYEGATSGSDQYPISDSSTYSQYNDQWHTYTLEWTPSYVNFLVDGTSIGDYDSSVSGFSASKIPDTAMHWILQTESEICDADCKPAASTAGNLQVAWAAAWSYDPSCTSVPCS